MLTTAAHILPSPRMPIDRFRGCCTLQASRAFATPDELVILYKHSKVLTQCTFSLSLFVSLSRWDSRRPYLATRLSNTTRPQPTGFLADAYVFSSGRRRVAYCLPFVGSFVLSVCLCVCCPSLIRLASYQFVFVLQPLSVSPNSRQPVPIHSVTNSNRRTHKAQNQTPSIIRCKKPTLSIRNKTL